MQIVYVIYTWNYIFNLYRHTYIEKENKRRGEEERVGQGRETRSRGVLE